MKTDFSHIHCIVFDYGFTLSSGYYFNVAPPGVTNWSALIQDTVFSREHMTQQWMRGEIGLPDIAELLARETGMEASELLQYMRQGCTDLGFNDAVHRFAHWVSSTAMRSVLVTANMDVFSEVIVKSHKLNTLFDAIINSAEVGTYDKTILWPMAFELVGRGISYSNSLLIEDDQENIVMFREQGGMAYQYVGEREFSEWLHDVDFGKNGQPGVLPDPRRLRRAGW